MVKKKPPTSKTREDWLRAGLEVLQERGIHGVKVVHIAKRLGVTSGSFYWHFNGLPDLQNGLLEYWEHQLTDAVIVAAKSFPGPPTERILTLMHQVIVEDAAAIDQTISVWSRSDPAVREVYQRTLHKRFDFARWMFEEAGFTSQQALARGRLMVVYLMGESSTDLKAIKTWKSILNQEFELLISRTSDAPAPPAAKLEKNTGSEQTV